jgi:hypothetical protein
MGATGVAEIDRENIFDCIAVVFENLVVMWRPIS